MHFNLDPLWASPAIDAVGIDNYMPLADWRDGDAVTGDPDGFRLADDDHHRWWQAGGAAADMVDPAHVFVWTWDARPYPAFPENARLWADGRNWQLGHWLSGRLGTTTVADAIAAILTDHGFSDFDVSMVGGDLTGYVQADPGSARSLLEPLMAAFQIDAVEEGGTLCFRSRLRAAMPAVEIDVLAEQPGETAFEEVRGHPSEFAGVAIIDHFDDAAAYQRVTARTRRMSAENDRVLRLLLPAVLHGGAAAAAAEAALRDHRAGLRRLTFRLPPNALGVMPGDVVRLQEGPAGSFLVTRVTEGAVREVEAQSFAGGNRGGPASPADQPTRPDGGLESAAFLPQLQFLDLPCFEAGAEESFARVAAYAKPWRPILVSSSPGADGYAARVRLERPACMGRLASGLGPGAWGRFDDMNDVEIDLPFGALSSKARDAVLGGENRMAIASSGGWEIVGFLQAEETAPRRWRLSGLLRGLAGSEDAMAEDHPPGSAAVLLDEAVRPLALSADEAGRSLNWIAEARGVTEPAGPVAFAGGVRARRPIAPVHLRGRRLASGGIRFSWTRRARRNADAWEGYDIPLDEPFEAYRLEILANGGAVRSMETEQAFVDYAAADEIADFGTAQSAITIRVRQLGLAIRDGIAVQRTLKL